MNVRQIHVTMMVTVPTSAWGLLVTVPSRTTAPCVNVSVTSLLLNDNKRS